MKKFVFTYTAPAMTGAPTEEVSNAWKSWFESLGAKLVDPGNPFGPGKTVSQGEVVDLISPVTGYTIVNAEDYDAALDIAKGSPMAHAPECSVSVYECMPM